MKRNILALVVITVLMVQISCSLVPDSLCGRSTLTETEAKEIAKKRLTDHCEQKEIDCGLFSEPEILTTEDVPWIVDYASEKNVRNQYHFFRVTIDHCGRIEKSHNTYNVKQ